MPDNQANTLIPSAVPANFEKLRGRINYSEWKFTIRYHLEDRELYAACTTGENVDDAVDRRARSAIVSSVSSNVIKELLTCETAKSMWDRLAALYEDNNPNRFISLNQEMFSTKFENCKDMAEYIEKMRAIGIKMRTILPTYPDQAVAANILTNLPSYFRPLTMALENSVQELTTDLVCEKLMVEYSKMGNQSQNAFAVKTTYSASNKFSGKCNACGKLGHKAKFCRSKSGKTNFNQSKSSSSKTDYHPKVREAWILTTELKDFNNEPWIIDSGCDRHMTSHKEWFINYTDMAPCPVMTGGTTLYSAGEGSVIINVKRQDKTVEVTLNNVLFVPGLTANLISVKYLATKLQVQTIFDDDTCTLIKKKTKEVLATGRTSAGKLYYLDTMQSTAMLNESKPMTKNDSINLWHKRLAHLSYPGLERLKSIAEGINFHDEGEECISCIKGKTHRQKFPKQKATRAKETLELIHTDLCGPMEVESHGGARYFMTLIDDKTRMTFISFLKTKDQAFQKFIDFKTYIEKQTGRKIKAIRSDRGTEYVNSQMQIYLEKEGIHHQKTIAYTPEQNGVAERCNRTLVERARTMLNEAKLDKRFWAEAVSTANYCKNRSPTIALSNKTPYEAWTNEKPDVSHMKIFGCKAFSHIPKSQRKKWDNKAVEMIFVGYSMDSKGYRLMNPTTFKITEARDVVFIESQSCSLANKCKNDTKLEIIDEDFLIPVRLQQQKATTSPIIDPVTSEDAESSDVNNVPETPREDLDSSNATNVSDESLAPRRSTRESKQPSYLNDFLIPDNLYKCHLMMSASYDSIDHEIHDIPLTYQEAINHRDASQWKGAILEELESHKKNHTWDLVTLPEGFRTIKNKWVFKIKCNSDGKPERYKARLVAKGCSQLAGRDYTETFSPVVRYDTLRVLIAFATLYDWDIDHLDAVVAFLQGSIEEELYMDLPEGLELSKERGDNIVCRLQKGIYGLKQSGRAWYLKLDNSLRNLGLTCADFDGCVYHMHNGKDILLVAVYVDDLLIFTSSSKLKHWIKEELFKQFEMKDLGELKYCLGIEIQRNKERGTTTMSQCTYIENVLERFGMQDSKPVSTPFDVNQRLSKSTETKDAQFSANYQSAIGCLLYAAKGTRPDITYVVGLLCQHCSNASKEHWMAAKRLMRYLRKTTKLKLQYSRSGNAEILGYCDADFAGSPEDRKSTSGLIFKLAGAAITWQSKKQTTVASSTVEAEYMALSSATKEALWLRKFTTELNLPSKDRPLKLYCDNKGAIDLSKNSMFHARTKHIDIAHHVTRNAVKLNQISVEKTSTETMVADSLTKPVPREKHNWCMNNMGLYEL